MTLTDHLKEKLGECTPTLEPSEKLRRSSRSLQPQHANFSANKNSLRFRDTNRQDEEGSCFSRTPPHRALQGSGDRTVGKHRAKKLFQDYIRHDTSLPQLRAPLTNPFRRSKVSLQTQHCISTVVVVEPSSRKQPSPRQSPA